MEAGVIRPVRAQWSGAVLVCGKCSKKLDGGFGAKRRTSLAKLLRKALGLGKGRKAGRGIVETKCLGLCPKNAVAVLNADRADRWFVVPAGTDVADIQAALFGPDPVVQA